MNSLTPESVQQTAAGPAPIQSDYVSETSDIVRFEADAAVVHATLPRVLPLKSSIYRSNNDALEHSIKSFLSRPYRIASGDWDISNGANDTLWSAVFPDALTSHPLISDKLRGFLGFRATTVVRVQVNAQRMQQGRLILCYVPMPTQLSLATPERMMHYGLRLLPKTCVPHVDLDTSNTSDVTLTAPYVSPSLFHSMVSHAPSFAEFRLVVYSPLVSLGTSTAEYSIWAHFEDIELFWPTDPNSFTTLDDLEHQMANSSEKELASKGKGPIQSVADIVFDVSDALTHVPLLSSIAKPVSWAAAAASKIAKFFGWSKPTDCSPPTGFVNVPYQGLCHSDGVDRSAKLALFSDNAVEALPGFAGSDRDELAIPAIASRFAYFKTFQWSTSDATDVQLKRFNNGAALSSLTANDREYGPMGYVANCFAYWRGTIRYRFKFVKTEFHSGRLLICFAPGVTNITPDGADYCYKTVVDIKLTDTVDFEVPFASAASWAGTLSSTGVVAVFVLNKLVAPDNVSQSIQVIVETSAGPDMCFAFPQFPRSLEYETGQPTADLEHQMDDAVSDNGLEHAKYTIGERVFSLRSLLKRFNTIAAGTGASVTVLPATYDFTGSHYDWYTIIAPLFALARGSFRVKVLTNSKEHVHAYNKSVRLANHPLPVIYDIAQLDPPDPLAETIVLPSLTGVVEVELPQYNNYMSYLPAHANLGVASSFEATQRLDVVGPVTRVYRAVGDDFDMGFFLFPPRIGVGPPSTPVSILKTPEASPSPPI